MGYCSRQQVINILNQALTTATNESESATDGSYTNLYEISESTRPNAISPSLVDQYILWAGEEIDAALSEMYAVPFSEKVDLQLRLLIDIDAYNPYTDSVMLDRARNLTPGDVVVFADDLQEERLEVVSIDNKQVFLDKALIGLYDSDFARVLRVKYPTAITLIASRLAAANIYDKYFTAEVSPNVSDYGKFLRSQAIRDLNNILNGRTILHGQQRIGHRFFNPNLRDRYRLPGIEQDGSRNIEDIR